MWPWPWIFKVKYGICYFSVKNGLIATKQKVNNVLIELYVANVTIGFDLGHDLDLSFSRSNVEFAISLPRMVRLPQNVKQTYGLHYRPQMWPSGMTFTLNFQERSNSGFAVSRPKMVWLQWNKKQTYLLNSRHQMWALGLTLALTLKGKV